MKSGDMTQIYQEHAQSVFKYLLGLSRNEDLAEELTQETFYRAVYSIEKYDGSCKLSVWLCQIAKHIWYQEIEKRKKRKAEPLGDDMISGDLPPEDAAIRRQEKIALYRAVQTLGEPMRDVVYLWLTGEFTFAEIGRVLGKSENWARTTFYRAKQKIFEEMG